MARIWREGKKFSDMDRIEGEELLPLQRETDRRQRGTNR
jgi:hypothetical protein